MPEQRILHILHVLDMGGIQKFVAELAAGGEQFDVLPLNYHADNIITRQLETAGCRILPALTARSPSGIWSYTKRSLTGYSVVHCHAYYVSALIHLALWRAGIRVRVQHVHSVMTRPGLRLTPLSWRWWASSPLRILLRWTATHRLAVSPTAAISFYGNWPVMTTDLVVYPGISSLQPTTEAQRRHLRQEWAVSPNSLVALCIGRLVPIKNIAFMLHVTARTEGLTLVIAGDGPDRKSLEDLARLLNISPRVIFLGERDDNAALMQAADVICLPSISESFSLVALEAQSLGIPVLASTGVPPAAFSLNLAGHRLLKLDINTWAHELRTFNAARVDPTATQKKFLTSKFHIANVAKALRDIYSLTRKPLT